MHTSDLNKNRRLRPRPTPRSRGSQATVQAGFGSEFESDILAGLRANPKRLPCKYFYDQRGSDLFDQICETDEYYLTRAELQIMRKDIRDISRQIGPGAMLIEYGSGSSIKTQILLDHLEDLRAYCPVDISRDHLFSTSDQLSRDYPQVEILAVCADFTQSFDLPIPQREPKRRIVYFPGSTIGNLEPSAAQSLLRQIARLCGKGGGLLIGIDLQKDVEVIEAAYNDAQGVTDAFNLNLLERINRELDADFDIDAFAHRAKYNLDHHRVDISLVSQRRQTVSVAGHDFHFEPQEAIHTEYSHKYSISGFAELAAAAGWTLTDHWTDNDNLFGVLLLTQQ